MNRAGGIDSRAQAGFTLLELLVAMTIMSLVATLMLAGLKFGVGAWRREAATNDAADSVEAAERVLRHQLSAIYPLWREGGQGAVTFAGSAQALEFVGQPPAQLGPGPDERYAITLSPAGDLMLGWSPLEGSGDAPAMQAVLLHGVQSIALTYFGPELDGRATQWTDSWLDRARLPALIRIDVRFPPGDPRTWPALTVHPQIVVDVDCIFDPISRGCRGRPQ